MSLAKPVRTDGQLCSKRLRNYAKGLCSAARNALHRDVVFLDPPPRLDHPQHTGLRWPVVFGRRAAGSAGRFRRATGRGFPALHAHHDRLHDRRHRGGPVGGPLRHPATVSRGHDPHVLSATSSLLALRPCPHSRSSPASPSALAARRASRRWWPTPRCGSTGTAASPSPWPLSAALFPVWSGRRSSST